MKTLRFCSECGAAIQSSAKFCASCGRPTLPTPCVTTIEQENILPTPDEPKVKQSSSSTTTAQPASELPISVQTNAFAKGVFTNGIFYFFTYLLVAIPTYLFPYFGSNSVALNSIGAAVGTGALPLAWFHLLALYLLLAISWLRGGLVGRQWIAVFPVFATIFDMVPGFNVIPLIPSVFHILAIVLGLSGKLVSAEVAGSERNRLVIVGIGVTVLTSFAFYKTIIFRNNISSHSMTSQLSKPASKNRNAQYEQQSHELKSSTNKEDMSSFINVYLEQSDNWKARIRIFSLTQGTRNGTIDFRSLNCGGTLQFERQQDNGFLFAENLDYGRCVPGCKIWLDEQGTFYKEICGRTVTGSGSLIHTN